MALMLLIGFALVGNSNVQAQNSGNGYMVGDFIDEDGDGFNDLAPDHDGDGIPNGQDADYIRPLDGTGNQFGNGGNQHVDNMFQHSYRYMYKVFNGDLDGGFGEGFGHRYGPGDSSGNNGNGQGGDCDGDGPHGQGRP